MADLITRLRLESSEYDSKIKHATQGLLQMEQECRKVGGTLAVLEDDQKAFVRSLGQMDTVCRTTRGRLAELTQAYTELSVQYKRLTDEEKKGDFGKALSQSLEQLKGRITETRGQIDEATRSLGQGNSGLTGALDSLAGEIGVSISSLAGWGTAIGAVKVAVDVAKDAFFASEANIDEWGRTVASAQSLYEGFLTALNTGDISGYLSRIDDIVVAARRAYDELDRLGTMKTIQAPQKSAQQTEIVRLQSMIRTRTWISAADGRSSGNMKDGQLLTDAQVRALEGMLRRAVESQGKYIRNEVEQTGKAINALYDQQATTLGMSRGEYNRGTSSWAEFSKRIEGYQQYKQWQDAAANSYYSQGGTGLAPGDASNPYRQYKMWGVFKDDGEQFQKIVGLIQQRDQQIQQLYGTQSQAYRTINRVEGISSRIGSGITASSKGTAVTTKPEYTPLAGSIDEQEKKVQDLRKAWRAAADDDSRTRIKAQIDEVQATLDRMEGKTAAVIPEGSMADLQKQMADLNAQQQLVTDPDEWADYAEQIDGVTQKMKALRGETEKPVTLDSLRQDITLDINTQNTKVDQETLRTILKDSIENSISGIDADLGSALQQIQLGVDVEDSQWQSILDKYNELREQMGMDPIKIDFTTGSLGKEAKDMEKNWQAAGTAIQAVGSAMSQIEDPAAKVVGTIAQAIATIALGYAQATTQAASMGPWAWIAFAATGLATMVSTISTIHSATGYANGGIIEGNTYSGDQIMANGGDIGLNAGELVLNRAQAGVIAAELQGGSGSGLHVTGRLSGEQIFLAAERWSKRTGRGEFVTW